MRRLLAYLLTVFALTSCSDDGPNAARTSTAHDAEVSYETDYPEPPDADEDSDPTARPAAQARGKLTIQYMNNETEVYRPQSYAVALWRTTDEPTSTNAPTTKPTYVVTKKANGRSYVRKTVVAGWYVAQYRNSDGGLPGGTFRFQVADQSNGLLCYNENSFWSVHFRGYYPSFGKIKCSWKTVPATDATANLTLTKDDASQHVWLYAEDGTGRYRGQYWFMPTGTYGVIMPGKTSASAVTIASSGKFPHLKFF